ncbi:MAG TPA: radical SAM protein [Rectinema sp.]|nr:radical SAM protein [Rectinema sp.]
MIFPFDTIQHSNEVEKLVMQGDKRRYYRFRYAKFYGGIITADAVGCNLLCAYCWNYSRNLDQSRYGEFYSPPEVAGKLLELSEKKRCSKFRISGAEPILGKASALHLADVISLVDGSFVIETNGVMLGADSTLIEILRPLPHIHVRLCVKAHDGADFEKITGAKAEGFSYQLKAAEALRKARMHYTIAVMTPFVNPRKLSLGVSEVEDLILYKSTKKYMEERGLI